MKRTLLLLLLAGCFISSNAQVKIANKKYPSLLWEITGNGLKKPSHLIGTMHVSNKLVFNLPDSFYIAIRNAQVVALESNPETWQEDMNKYDLGSDEYGTSSRYTGYSSELSDYLTVRTLKFYKYDTKIERSLYSSSTTINNLLYRTYGNESSDFEEDTYLDMYIFQCGKKWGKRVTGVEDYGESMRLMSEAYKDAAKEKKKKQRSYTDDGTYSTDRLQEAYRTGNLDLLDSINKYNSTSDAFDEKFLYRRNEIQANNIDSIIRSGSSLFVGVGAAHLPGDRGVIELLRKKGYKLRPVKMGERASKEKDIIDKLRVPVIFRTETASDGLYKVDIPGKFYKFGDDPSLDQQQYADMSNGSYYMVTRIMTNAWMWNHNYDDVYRTLDSLLYENIPGKIVSKTAITRNGYKGIDVSNRTRRGDVQRYNIFITPFEIVFFKMSGNGDYVQTGTEANRFFNSIQLKEYKNAEAATPAWKKYSPSFGGFSVELPHEPYIGNDGSWIFDATDKTSNTQYRVIRTDIHNDNFAEEDSFDLGLMDESFSSSGFIAWQISRKQTKFKGYPALDVKYRDKSGGIFLTRFIIQGAHYYTLIAHGNQEVPVMTNFLNSFELKPFVYGEAKLQRDTALYYSVKTPVFPESKKIKLDMPVYGYSSSEEEESEDEILDEGTYRSKLIANDTTGEKISVVFHRSGRYTYRDTTDAKYKNIFNDDDDDNDSDSLWVTRYKKTTTLPNKTRVYEHIYSEPGSSRAFWTKSWYKDGIYYALQTQIDTLTKASDFIRQFYETFTPSDTLKGVSIFDRKTKLFFDDLASSDSTLHKRAVKNISSIDLDSDDLPQLKKAISSLTWKEKKYLDVKSSLIGRLRDIKTPAVADYIKSLYYSLDDTVQLQYAALEALLQQQNQYSFNVFRDIITNEPPVLNISTSSNRDYSYRSVRWTSTSTDYDNGSFLDDLSDSLLLTKTILPDLLPLLNLEDYKSNIMGLLKTMIDSNIIKPSDYSAYFSKFFIEAKQELKKQAIAEKQKAIDKAEEDKDDSKEPSYYADTEEKDEGNDDLAQYATLLLPFWDSNPNVQTLIQQMLKSNDKQLRYSTLVLLIKHNKPYPDSLLRYFASMDEYRHELYKDLGRLKKLDKFPALYNNHLDLGKSELKSSASYTKPDTVVYLDRIKTQYKDRKGYIYFFKYREKKDDVAWKIASVGLLPEDGAKYEFDRDTAGAADNVFYPALPGKRYFSTNYSSEYDFTDLSSTKLNPDESVTSQLATLLKKMLYSRRESAKNFYQEENEYGNYSREYVD